MALVGKAYMMGQTNKETAERAIVLGAHFLDVVGRRRLFKLNESIK